MHAFSKLGMARCTALCIAATPLACLSQDASDLSETTDEAALAVSGTVSAAPPLQPPCPATTPQTTAGTSLYGPFGPWSNTPTPVVPYAAYGAYGAYGYPGYPTPVPQSPIGYYDYGVAGYGYGPYYGGYPAGVGSWGYGARAPYGGQGGIYASPYYSLGAYSDYGLAPPPPDAGCIPDGGH